MAWCREQGYGKAADAGAGLGSDGGLLCLYPEAHWPHIRIANPLESPFAALRLRTEAAKRYNRVDRATALIWKLLMGAEKRFRRLRGWELLPRVYRTRFQNHPREEQQAMEEVAA